MTHLWPNDVSSTTGTMTATWTTVRAQQAGLGVRGDVAHADGRVVIGVALRRTSAATAGTPALVLDRR
jgi:hypothetical protein